MDARARHPPGTLGPMSAQVDLGAVVDTPGGGLPSPHVLHVAVTGGRPQDLQVPLRGGSLTSAEILRVAMLNCLALAEALDAATVGVPMKGGSRCRR